MQWFRAAIGALCLLFAGCSQQELMAKFEPHPESEMARGFIDDLRQGDFAKAQAMMSNRLRADSQLDTAMKQVSDAMAGKPVRSVRIIGAYTNTLLGKDGRSTYNLTYEYELEPGWMVFNVVLQRAGDEVEVVGFHGQMLDRSLEKINTFSFAHAGGKHFLMLLLMMASFGFCLYAFITCLRTPIRKRKWLWALLTLVGFTTLSFNWTQGSFSFQPLSFQLFSASWVKQAYGPVVMGVSLPLGAIWFMARRKALMATQANEANAAPLSTNEA